MKRISIRNNRNKSPYGLNIETMESRNLLAADLLGPPPIIESLEDMLSFAAVFSLRQSTPQSDLILGDTGFDDPAQSPTTISIDQIGSHLINFSNESNLQAVFQETRFNSSIHAAGKRFLPDPAATNLFEFFNYSTDIRDSLNSVELDVAADREIERMIDRSSPPAEATSSDPIVLVDLQRTIDIAGVPESLPVVSDESVGVTQSRIGTIQTWTPLATLSSELQDVNAGDTISSEPGDGFEEVTPLENSSTFRSQSFEFSTVQIESEANQTDAMTNSQNTSEAAESMLPEAKASIIEKSQGGKHPQHPDNRSPSSTRQAMWFDGGETNSQATTDTPAPAVLMEKASIVESSHRKKHLQHPDNRSLSSSWQVMWRDDVERLESFDIEMERTYSELPSFMVSLDAQLPDHEIDRQFEEMLVENGIVPVLDSPSAESEDDAEEGDYARASRRILSPIILIAIPYAIHRRGRPSDTDNAVG